MPDFIEQNFCKTQNANLKTNLILKDTQKIYCKFLPTACVTRLGWEGRLAAETGLRPSRKTLQKRERTPSRMHAVLGRLDWKVSMVSR